MVKEFKIGEKILNLRKEKTVSIKKSVNLTKVAAFLIIILVAVAFSYQEREIPKKLDLKAGKVVFNSSRFQSSIKSDKSLGTLAKEVSTIGEQAISFGFAAKSEEAKIFIIGALYSEALAHLRSGKMDLASKRLESIGQEFININVPTSLFNYISNIANMVETQRYSSDVILEFLSLFQPFYEDYANSKGEDKLILFRAGSWLVDMSLTAAAQDKAMLKQLETLNYFIKEMKRMDAPKGVLNSLDEILKIADKEEKDITDKDVKDVLKLVKKIQTILG